TPAFYPGTSDPNKAQWIDLVPGQEFTASFRIATVPALEIRGRLAWNGEVTNGFLRLATGLAGEGPECPGWHSEPESREFHISGLSPGTYVLEVTAKAGSESGVYRKTVQVGSTDVELLISPDDKVADFESAYGISRGVAGH